MKSLLINGLSLKIKKFVGILLAFFSHRATVSEVAATGLVTSTVIFLGSIRFLDFTSYGFIIAGLFSILVLLIIYLIKLRNKTTFIFQTYIFLIVFVLGFTNCILRYFPPEKLKDSGLVENVLIRHGEDFIITRKRIVGKGKILGIVKDNVVYTRFFNRNVIYDLSPGEQVLVPGTVTISSGYFSRVRNGRMDEDNYNDRSNKMSSGYRNYLLSINNVGYIYGYSKRTEIFKDPSYFRVLSFKAKAYIHRVFENLLPWPQSSFCEAVITGNRKAVPEFVSSLFKKSGTIHILAVSGLHVGILIGLLTIILRVFSINIHTSLMASIIFVGLYAGFVGNRVSVQRASLMTILGVIGFLMDRDRDFLNILSLSFVILWFFNPFFVYNPGFLLSFSSVLGIILFAPYLQRLFTKSINRYLSGLFSSTLSVQVFLIPVMLYFFEEYAISNIVANLFIVPLMGLNLGFEILLLAIYPISLFLANIIAEIVTMIVTGIIYISYLFSKPPQIKVENFPGYGVILYFVVILALTVYFKAMDFNNENTGG